MWLQADVAKLHGEVIDSLLDSMHKTGFIMVPTFGIYEANRDVERAMTLPWHATYTLPAVMDSFFPNPAHHASYFYEWTFEQRSGLSTGVPPMDGICELITKITAE